MEALLLHISASKRPAHVAGLLALAAVISAVLLFPGTARADAYAELQEIRATIEELNASYDEACTHIEELNAEAAKQQETIDYLEADLIPEQKEKAAEAFEAIYRLDKKSVSLIDYVLSAGNFYDLLSSVKYIESIYAYNQKIIDELLAQEAEVSALKQAIEAELAEAEEEASAAHEALEAAEASREEIMERIAAQEAAEAAARQAALEAAAKAEAEAAAAAEKASSAGAAQESSSGSNGSAGTTDQSSSGAASAGSDAGSSGSSESSGSSSSSGSGSSSSSSSSSSSASTSSGLSAIDWTVGKDAFISTWTTRIDAYLSGSPLAGYGSVFAEAAWSYCVDPRLSPAISNVESSKGRYCYRSYNAWGWGGISWSSWEEAIWAHVKGLASGYGGVLSVEGAKKYCPTNPDTWYANVLANMKKI